MDPEFELVVVGWPADGPTLRLDYRQFSYAGKFVMSNTGKAIVRETGPTDAGDIACDSSRDDEGDDASVTAVDAAGVLAAAAFNEDRTDASALWIRYVTVREDRRGEGIAPRLCAFVADRADERGYDRVRIAVNNPFAYEALYRAGFGYTGEQTGIAELLLERPAGQPDERSADAYQAGLDRYRERDLSDEEVAFLERKRGDDSPPI